MRINFCQEWCAGLFTFEWGSWYDSFSRSSKDRHMFQCHMVILSATPLTIKTKALRRDLHQLPADIIKTWFVVHHFRDGAALAAKTKKKEEQKSAGGEPSKKWSTLTTDNSSQQLLWTQLSSSTQPQFTSCITRICDFSELLYKDWKIFFRLSSTCHSFPFRRSNCFLMSRFPLYRTWNHTKF